MTVEIGAEAFLDLSGKIDHIHKHGARRKPLPVRKPVGGSLVIPASFTTPQLLLLSGSPARGRVWNILKVGIFGSDPHTSGPVSTVSQPAVPASTVAQQNVNQFPVQVVISAGTITNVSVNGVTVGTTAGTYTVPANGAISITYTVAPTWVWTALGSTGVTVDVYAGNNPDPSAPVFTDVILSGQPVPSITQFSKEVEWCSTGQNIFALFYGTGLAAGQVYSVICRVAEYEVRDVEASGV